jgi:hypothetical protein
MHGHMNVTYCNYIEVLRFTAMKCPHRGPLIIIIHHHRNINQHFVIAVVVFH